MRFVFLAVLIASPATADRLEPAGEPAQQRQATRPGPSIAPHPQKKPPPVRPYTPPAEVAKLARELDGAWTCKGVLIADDRSSQPIVGTMTTKLELGGAWMQTSFANGTVPRFVAFRTYDAIERQWTRIYFDSTAGRVEETSLGEKNGLWTWTGTSTTTTGSFEARDFEQRDGTQLKMWGELLLGGQWQKLYEVTCKK